MALRILAAAEIIDRVVAVIGQITFNPDPAIEPALQKALNTECNPTGRDVLDTLIENIACASADRIPLCQDTGTLVVFAELGCDLQIQGGALPELINQALTIATQKFYLRATVVKDPLFERTNTQNNTPAIVHVKIVEGDKLRLKIAQKGGGAENMSRLKMLTPSATQQEITDFAVETVTLAGAKACPPLVVGIGIGGNFETCALLAKEALLQPLNQDNPDTKYAKLESTILQQINQNGVGAQGMGGNTTALAVHIIAAPCHIASLPVAVNLQCHAHRHLEIIL